MTDALLPINGNYTTAYGYEAPGTSNLWEVYDVTAPQWVNDLEVLQNGHGYWINVSQPVTLYLQISGGSTTGIDSSLPCPPANHYGQLLDGWSFSPEPGWTSLSKAQPAATSPTMNTELIPRSGQHQW